MGQVSGFEFDIFISYSHDDNYPVAGGDGWVNQFHEQLENWLVRRRGLSELKIWRDPSLDGNTLFNEAIQDKVKRSALFFVLHSRNYRKSEYCRKELDWFHQYNNDRPGGLQVGDRLRIFNILLNNFPPQEWPAALGATSGFPMHDAEDEGDLGDFISLHDPKFGKCLRKIVDAVEDTLREFSIQTAAPEESTHEARQIRVYLADAADTLQATRDRLSAEIEQRSVSLVSDIPPPMGSASHRQSVELALGQTALAVHLLDQWPGRKIVDNKSTSYPREQAELSIASPVPSIIWVPPELKLDSVEDESHRKWLRSLRDGARDGSSYEFVSNDQTALINLVAQRLTELQQSTTADNRELSFLIDTHQKDQRYAYELASLLAEKNIEVEFNKEARDPIESLGNFERAVKHVRNLIIMFGGVGAPWLNGRIKRAVKIVAEQFEADRSDTLEKIWIYLLPGKEQFASPRLPGLIQVDLLDNRNSQAIDPQLIDVLLAADADR